jgi:hypothetical protein
MSSTKQAIPSVHTGDQLLDLALSAMKQNLDQITGQARNAVRLVPLASTASSAQIIERLNAITERLQS